MLTQFEMGWLAGLLEGEGNFGYYGGTPSINLRMIDKDTMDRTAKALAELIGTEVVVRVIEPPYESSRQTVYYLQLYGDRARIAMRALVPFMCKRRRQQIWRALNSYRAPKQVIDITSLIK